MEIQIHTYDNRVAFALFGSPLKDGQTVELKSGQAVEVATGIEAEYLHCEKKYALGWPEIVAFVVTVSAAIPPSVAASLITEWLLFKIPRKPEKIVIERNELEFEEGEIKRVIQEKIEWTRR